MLPRFTTTTGTLSVTVWAILGWARGSSLGSYRYKASQPAPWIAEMWVMRLRALLCVDLRSVPFFIFLLRIPSVLEDKTS